jgi:hypothetical protein
MLRRHHPLPRPVTGSVVDGMRAPRAGLLFLAWLAFSTSACSVLYAVNADEENLLCGPDDGTPRCLDGFACVKADDDLERCVRAGFKEVGDDCVVSEECVDGAVCADAWATRCPQGADDSLDCALVDASDRGLKCRAPCDARDFTCPSGTRCFAGENDGDVPFCQQGTCAADSDCVAGGVGGLCIEEALSGGRSGLCRVQCEPLRCFEGGPGCPCLPDENCAGPVDETVSARAVCSAAGVIGEGLTCNAANPCEPGLTCVLRSDGLQVCLRWCAVAGGAPACGGNLVNCTGVVGDPSLGICQ